METSDVKKLKYHVEIMRRSGQPRWTWKWSSQFMGDAIEYAANKNRGWSDGEAAHRVVDALTGKEIYRRGWVRTTKK